MAATREWPNQNGFIAMDTPILTPAAAEGTTTLFETEYFDEGKACLAQTGQLYNEANIFSFGKVYCFGPTFRAEKSETRRHLELRKYGSVPHSGFGMGTERVTSWICGIKHVREAIAFLRTIKRAYP